MSAELRPLIMRANRLLGASLVEHNLVTLEQLEAANEKLLEVLAGGGIRQSTLLGLLVYELKVLREEAVLQHLVDEQGLGCIDLRVYETSEELRQTVDIPACWATWSVPFDREEDFICIATAYYLSPAVRAYWEKQLGTTNILWYGSTLEGISDFLEKIEAERAAAAAKKA